MNYSDFINPNLWIGGFYELSMEFHPVGDHGRLNQALVALGNLDFFNGLWKERQHYLSDIISLPIDIDDDSVNQFYGTLTLSDGNTLPCVVTIVRIIDESDWLDIGIPLAILERVYPLNFSLAPELNPWLVKIDEVFIRIAKKLFDRSPFELALIGEEISGYTNQETITLEELEKITCLLPNRIQEHLGISQGDEGKGSGYCYLLTNKPKLK